MNGEENVCGCIDCLVPHNNPFPVGINKFGRLSQSNNLDLEDPEVLGAAIISCDGVLSHEDMIEVNCMSCSEVGPL